MAENTEARDAVGDYKYGFHGPENHTIRFDSGLSEQVVRDISALKDEPEWMTEIRVKAYQHFADRPMPTWGNMSIITMESRKDPLKAKTSFIPKGTFDLK